MLEKVEDNRNLKVLPEQNIRGGFQEKHRVVLKRGSGEARDRYLEKINIGHARLGVHSIPRALKKKRISRPVVAKAR
jgi:hypothetical protein